MSTKKSKRDIELKVVKKIKDGDEITEIKKGDPTRVWRNLRKIKTLGQAITYIDKDNFCDVNFDFMALAWIFEDLYEETNNILLKYGLSSF
ncbi:MAG: hypothetical protein AMJ42_03045 [Deltaproteobacteria bacterium DG_8]|nr:MAG: hypothetical protein AMJ42_03045 [Deltaproteobacteria bacterium DG_8]